MLDIKSVSLKEGRVRVCPVRCVSARKTCVQPSKHMVIYSSTKTVTETQLMTILSNTSYSNLIHPLKMDEKNQPPPDKHAITCECDRCKEENGDLPLLVRVIEQRCQAERSQEPTPSTSKDASSSPRKPMSCEHCHKTFYHRGDLNKHLRTHTKEKPYECRQCKKKFAHTSNLLRHNLLHTGVRPFVCELCGKSFSRKDKLEEHKGSRTCRNASHQS
ncbi:zinc finger protein 729-like [Aethina tumida]|uniref:zinc finger protein 729-like n=1 Tax=Aethina tumida TaxID=116153 RepID=UPI0021490209|nr:zinc finger protein 729-like [Aethina tumida]